MRLLHRTILPALLALVTACGGGDALARGVTVDTLPGGIPRTMSAAPIDSGRWSLVLGREIQPPEGTEGELFNPAGLAIADDGHLLVVEQNPAQVKVYSPTGEHLRTIGRNGEGPGEYRAAFIALRGDTMLVQDPRNSRVSTVNWRTGELVTTRRSACCHWAPIGIDVHGQAWLRTIFSAPDSGYRYVQGYLRVGLLDGPMDTLWAYERRDLPETPYWQLREGGVVRMSTVIPFQPRAHFAVDPAGVLVTGWSGEYQLRTTRTGRDTVALFGRRWQAEPVSAGERQRIYDEAIRGWVSRGAAGGDEAALRRAFDSALIPALRPAYDHVQVDDAGRRWLLRSDADTSRTRFDLFDAEGRWLDIVEVDPALWTRNIYTGIAWGRREVAVSAEGDDGRPIVRIFTVRRR